ncbi:MAG: MurR/RpiR family transcriptional regulator [Sphaerochaeta sp.]
MSNLLQTIVCMSSQFTQNELKVKNALLRNPSAVISLSINEFAERVGTSSATLTRFCKHIGLTGFSELRLSIAKSIAEDVLPTDVSNRADDKDLSKIADETVSSTFHSIKSTFIGLEEIIDYSKFFRAADKILSARRILLCGVGASYLVAEDFYQKLIRIGIIPCIDIDIDLMRVQVSYFDSRDLVVAFSYSGTKTETLSIVELASSTGTGIISFTKQGNNPIAALSDINIPVIPAEPEMRVAAGISRLQMLALIDVLFNIIISRGKNTYEKLMETWTNVSGKGEDVK